MTGAGRGGQDGAGLRIRNKMLLAMSVPVGLLVVQVLSVNHFVRELQAATSFIGSAHGAIEADFVAADLVGKLRQEVRQLPSAIVVERVRTDADLAAQRRLWNELAAAIELINASNAVQTVAPQVIAALDTSLGRARGEYELTERLVAVGSADLNSLIERSISVDRALVGLEDALNTATIELRRELKAAVDRERAIHNRPAIAGIVIGGSAVALLLAFAWLYVDRHLARRMAALSRSMLAIASGDLRAPLPAMGGDDEITAMAKALSVFRDTASEVEEQSLRERQVVLDTINYGVLILDPWLRVRMHNRAFRDLWAAPSDALRPGSPMASLLERLLSEGVHGIPPSDWNSYVDRRIADIRAADKPPSEWHRADGRVLQYEVAPLPDGGRMLTYFDLTEVKRVEAELRVAKEQAELASRIKSDFLASMSHELRTPLNAIIGITEMLKEDAEADSNRDLEEPLGRVLRAGKLLLQLINEVLDLAKIEAGKLELQPEEIDLRTLLVDVMETAEPLAEKNDNCLILDVEPELGRVLVDTMRLRQILLNLLSNACKFTERGQVTLLARHDGKQFELAVQDTGIGIEAEQLPNLFQDFHQAGAAKLRKYGGTGLGLAISRRLARLMGGDIGVESELGKGSVFTVKLPVRLPACAEAV